MFLDLIVYHIFPCEVVVVIYSIHIVNLSQPVTRDFGLGPKGMAAFKCWGFLLKAPATTGLIAYEWDTYLLWYS